MEGACWEQKAYFMPALYPQISARFGGQTTFVKTQTQYIYKAALFGLVSDNSNASKESSL